jgi:hypothetical protein
VRVIRLAPLFVVLLTGCSLLRFPAPDATVDAGDAGTIAVGDGGPDAGPMDGGDIDAGPDAGTDGGTDAGPFDAGCMTAVCADSDTLLTCMGGAYVPTTCPFGCAAAVCRTLVPSNVGTAVSMTAGTGDISTPGSVVVNSDTGLITIAGIPIPLRSAGTGEISGIHFQVLSTPEGPDLGVFVMRSLTINAGHEVRAYGANALVILVTNDVEVNGTINLTGDQLRIEDAFGPRVPGAGGSTGGINRNAGMGLGGGGQGTDASGGSAADSGGAGGTFGSRGGSGGSPPGATGGSPATTTYGNPQLIPLYGGSGGGGGGDNDGAVGGPGGGALHIAARAIRIGATGRVDAGGGGGRQASGGGGGGGGGGGSGGAVLLEASTVTVEGRINVSGGGGSSGDPSAAGTNGDAVPPAMGGASSGTGSAAGGNGSDATGSDGATGSGSADNGGAGGGGAGRIRMNTRSGSARVSGMVYPGIGSPLTTQGTVTASP